MGGKGNGNSKGATHPVGLDDAEIAGLRRLLAQLTENAQPD